MVNIETLPEEERKKILARRAYQKEWRKNNRDKCREYTDRFFQKKVENNGGK